MREKRCFVLALVLSLGLFACGGGDEEATPADADLQASAVSYVEGALQVDVQAQVLDAEGLPVAGVVCLLRSDRGAVDELSPAQAESGEDGSIAFVLRSNEAGYPKLQLYLAGDDTALGDVLDVDLGLSLSMENGAVRLGPAGWSVEFQASLDADIAGVPLELTSDRGEVDSVDPAVQDSVAGDSVSFTVTSTTAGAPFINLRMQGIANSNVASSMVMFNHGASLSAGELEPLNPGGRIPVTVTVNDEVGPVEGMVLSLSSDRGASDTIDPASANTDDSGQAVFEVSTTEAGQPTLTLAMDGLELGTAPGLQLDFSGI